MITVVVNFIELGCKLVRTIFRLDGWNTALVFRKPKVAGVHPFDRGADATKKNMNGD